MTFPAPPAVAKTQVLMDFITSLGWDGTEETGYPMRPGPEVQTSPDRLLTLTPTSGPGWATDEGSLDTWGFQARLRGPDDDPLEPELKSQQLDAMILFAVTPVTIDGTLIANIQRTGSPPVPLPLDPADRRFEYVCTYLITTGGE